MSSSASSVRTDSLDLNLSNVLTDGTRISGVVDWDESGLGGRALDPIALAVDCESVDRGRMAPQ
jgi:Ser/Thr protein kinase RdoA (MazF antagonist)